MQRLGGCACGAIRFEVTAPIIGTGSCHCTDCQKASGGGPNFVALVPKGALRVVSGEPRSHKRQLENGATAERVFCGDCGTPLWSNPPHQPFHPVKVGAFDDAADLGPQMQIYTSSAPLWHRLNPDVPSFAKMPPGPV